VLFRKRLFWFNFFSRRKTMLWKGNNTEHEGKHNIKSLNLYIRLKSSILKDSAAILCLLRLPPPPLPRLFLCGRQAFARGITHCRVVHLLHCTENSKQIFPEIKLRGLVSNFYIHVSVSDTPTIGPLFCCIAFTDQSWEYIYC
jgi:hypothetical protein